MKIQKPHFKHSFLILLLTASLFRWGLMLRETHRESISICSSCVVSVWIASWHQRFMQPVYIWLLPVATVSTTLRPNRPHLTLHKTAYIFVCSFYIQRCPLKFTFNIFTLSAIYYTIPVSPIYNYCNLLLSCFLPRVTVFFYLSRCITYH